MTQLIENIKDWRSLRGELAKENKSVGFVPTMGALHEGHSSLVRKSKSENDVTLVSIFVNPTQFEDSQDLEKYPRTLVEDLKRLESDGADYVLFPRAEDMYADKYQYQVVENILSRDLCGAHRPGHFQGVLTVVLKLLNIAEAHRAYFGEKDFQQYVLIRGMAEAFFLKTEIVPCPTVREQDGLAMSSRNTRLSSDDRQRATLFPELLEHTTNPEEITRRLIDRGFFVDYIEEKWGRRFGAVRLGDVRLIDNVKI